MLLTLSLPKTASGIPGIFYKLHKLDDTVDKIITTWISSCSTPSGPLYRKTRRTVTASWMDSYLSIEKILVALLELVEIRIPDSSSYHRHVLEEVTKVDSPFRIFMATNIHVESAQDRRALGLRWDKSITVHWLLDGVRRYRNWSVYSQHEGASQPTNDRTAIDLPTGTSLRLWYSLVIDALVGSLKFCQDRDDVMKGKFVWIYTRDEEANQESDSSEIATFASNLYSQIRQGSKQQDAPGSPQIAANVHHESMGKGLLKVLAGATPTLEPDLKFDGVTEVKSSVQKVTLAGLQAMLPECIAVYERGMNERIATLEESNAELTERRRQNYQPYRRAASQRDEYLSSNKKLEQDIISSKSTEMWTKKRYESLAQERDLPKSEMTELKANQAREIADAVESAKEELRKQIGRSLLDTLSILVPTQHQAVGTVDVESSPGFITPPENASDGSSRHRAR